MNDDRLKVYSANNVFLRNHNPSVKAVLNGALVIQVTASEFERSKRLGERSPDMLSAERYARISDDGNDISHPDMEVINTSGLSNLEGQITLRATVERVMIANDMI